ncbi:MAG: transglutaminase domain-containing protein [Theionarchaea archaeon]|nr:transglutaminase domain-containing protein [Theionarchaea archaeon]
MQFRVSPLTISVLKKAVIISAIMVMFAVVMGGSLNPFSWKTQCERFISPQQLIQPEKTAAFYAEMEDSVKDNPVQIFSVIERKIRYTGDVFNYKALNHLATAEEVLQSGRDDCDGQAVLLCSVLQYAGYTSFTVIGPNHAWVEVETEEPLLINYKGGDWIVKFNDSSIQWNYTAFLFMMLGNFFLMTVFFSIVLYMYKKGFQTYVTESFGYFKYIFLLLILVAAAAVIMARWWVSGLLTSSIALLFIMEVISRIRKKW